VPLLNTLPVVAPTFTIDKAPATPTGFAVEPGNMAAKLSWAANTEADLAQYNLYAGPNSPPTGMTSVLASTTSYIFPLSVNGQKYYFRMTAVDKMGNESDFTTPILEATPDIGLVFKKDQTITFTPITGKTFGDAPFDADITNPSSLPVTLTTNDPFTVDIVGHKITILRAGTVTIYANAAGNNEYKDALEVSQTFTIEKEDVVILGINTVNQNPNGNSAGFVRYQVNFSKPVVGLKASNFTLSGDLKNNATIKPILNLVPNLPNSWFVDVAIDANVSGTIQLNFENSTGLSNSNITYIPVGETYTIDQTPPAIPTGLKAEAGDGEVRLTWNANTESDLGDYLILFGTTTKPNLFLAFIGKGTTTYLQQGLVNGTTYFYRLVAADKLNNESDYSTETTATPMAGNTLKTAQNITFDVIPTKTYGDGEFLLPNTSTDKNLPITYTSDDQSIATVTGNLVHIVKKGTVVIHANAAGNQSIADALEQTQTLVINPVAITVTANAQVKLTTESDPAFTYTYTGKLVAPDDFGGSLTRTNLSDAPGTYPITLGSLFLSPNYVITYVGANLTINDKKDQSIDFKPLPKLTYGDALNDFDPKASASSGLAISYTSSNTNVATIVNGLIHVKSAGTTTISAEQGGGSIYKPALTATQDLTVAKMDISIQPDAKVKALGEQDPTFTYQIVKGKLVGSDKFSGSLERAAGEEIGTYPISIGSLALNDNYNIQLMPANLVIELKSFDAFVKDATNVLTPNADGMNDYLVFNDLTKYPPIAIVITDRLGRVIYKNAHYQNNWDGTYAGKALATDTYYYYLDFGKGYSKVKGYVTIVNPK
jgi:gliding motility-associated-like protein